MILASLGFAIADLNGDGNLDIVTATTPSGLEVYLGQGNGSFSSALQPLTGGSGSVLAVGDINGDGKPDLVAGDGFADTFVFLGNGDGTFQSPSNFNAGYQVTAIVAGDLNGNGKADVVAGTSNDLAVLLSNGDGTLQAPVNYGSGIVGSVLTLADFNRDGFIDVEAGGRNQDLFQMFLGNGNGSLQAPLMNQVGGVVPGDFTNNGILDLVSQYELQQHYYVEIAVGIGNGTFSTGTSQLLGPSGGNMVADDFNRDGKLDLASTLFGNNTGSVAILLGNGDGTLQLPVTYATDQGSIWLASGDFNGAGFPDLAVTNQNSNDVSVLLNKGDGTFLPATNYPTGTGASKIVVGDFNEDGKLDLLICDRGPVTLLLGNGDGTFRSGPPSNASCAQTLVATDFNGDGHLDLIVDTDPNYTIWYGKGDGTFSSSSTVNLYVDFASLSVADMNGDGAPDIVWEGNSLAVLLNTGGTNVTTTSSANPSKFGQPVTLTTKVAASVPGSKAVPTGTVTFKYKNRVLGKANLMGGIATLTNPKPPVGSFAITPMYSGDANFNPHKGAPLVQQIQR